MWKPAFLFSFLVILAGCQATSETNIDPQLQPVGQVRAAGPEANPYLRWQRGF
jgi:hypothetical protein